MENDNLKRIKHISKKFRLLFSVLIVCIPTISLAFWLCFNYLPDGFTSGFPVVINQALPFSTIMLAFLVSLIPASVAIYGVFTLKELFTLYENGIIFSASNVLCFRKLGYTFISWVIANFLYSPLISVVLTYNNPPGERTITIGFDSSDLATLIIGAIVVTISWVMIEASKLHDEQTHTV